jgi:lipopolysaccharide transport protein LptA
MERSASVGVRLRASRSLSRTHQQRRRWPSVALTAMAALCGSLSAQSIEEPVLPLELYADSASFGPEGTTFHQVRITRGFLTLEADEAVATGPHYETSEWTLRGNVRLETEMDVIEADEAQGDLDSAANKWRFSGEVTISIGTARLWADVADFTFEANRLATAELTGAPATFEAHGPDDEVIARGSATRFEYSGATQTLRLVDDVTAEVGPEKFTASELLYDFGGARVTSASSLLIRLDSGVRDSEQPTF